MTPTSHTDPGSLRTGWGRRGRPPTLTLPTSGWPCTRSWMPCLASIGMPSLRWPPTAPEGRQHTASTSKSTPTAPSYGEHASGRCVCGSTTKCRPRAPRCSPPPARSGPTSSAPPPPTAMPDTPGARRTPAGTGRLVVAPGVLCVESVGPVNLRVVSLVGGWRHDRTRFLVDALRLTVPLHVAELRARQVPPWLSREQMLTNIAARAAEVFATRGDTLQFVPTSPSHYRSARRAGLALSEAIAAAALLH